MRRDDDGRYHGYGVCPECGGPIGRLREDGLTIDRCLKCRSEWEHADRMHPKDWRRVE